MQIDLLPDLPPSGGYENIITAIDVFSRYAFAYPVSNPAAVNTARIIINNNYKTCILTYFNKNRKGSVFVTNVKHERTDVLGITFCHATTKHAQTIGVFERTDAMIKISLTVSLGEFGKQWHKNLPLAILNYHTNYQTSIGCEPTEYFPDGYCTTYSIRNWD